MELAQRIEAELLLRRRQGAYVPPAERYRTFQKKYLHDPVGFARDCIIWPASEGLTDYQAEILAAIVAKGRVAVRGPHGLGKSAVAAIIVLWWALVHDGWTSWKVAITAGSWAQLIHYTMPEVHKWVRQLNWDRIGRASFNTGGELLRLSLQLETGAAFAVASDKPELIEGAHAQAIGFVYDESKSIGDAIFDATEGAFASPESSEIFAFACSTPGSPKGRFYDIHSRKSGYEEWWVKHVTIDEAIAAGRISASWADARKRQWGENSHIYITRVLGDFATESVDAIIPLSWIEAANLRWVDWQDKAKTLTGIGVDVGGGALGGDKSTLALCYNGNVIGEVRKIPRAIDPQVNTMELANRVMGILDNVHRQAIVSVDIIGIGAGVAHRLREMGYNVLGFNAAARTGLRDVSGEMGFSNWRACAWWLLREMLAPDSGFEIALPPDDELTGDLTAPRLLSPLSGNLIRVESKEDVRKRLGRSTDCADAVLHILIGPALARETQDVRQELHYEPVQIGKY